MGSQWGAIIEEAAQIPFPVPTRLFERTRNPRRPFPPLRGQRPPVVALLHHLREVLQYRTQEPSHPDAFAAAFHANPVHAVVPIARTEQGHAVGSESRGMFDGALAVIPQRRSIL